MKEIELKFLEVDKRELVRRLLSKGAKLTFSGRMHALMFDYPDKRLRKQGTLIRLRKYGRNIQLTMKKKFSMKDVMAARETEFKISDMKAAETLLKGIGLVQTGETRKWRDSYKLGDAEYEFDTMEGIPTYLEIESDSLPKLRMAIREIGLDMKDAKPWNTRQVLEYYGRH
jgi:predicted adenylyl cyclase CyaB